MKYFLLLVAFFVSLILTTSIRNCTAQTGPTLEHVLNVQWWQPIGMLVVTAETTSKQYPIVDLYVALDSFFPPTRIGSLGTLFINPGALVYGILGFQLYVNPYKKWETGRGFFYPPIPRALVGTKFRAQVVAYDATVPNRVVLSANYVTVTIVN